MSTSDIPLDQPPTEAEVARLLDVLRDENLVDLAITVHQLVHQRDHLKQLIEGLLRQRQQTQQGQLHQQICQLRADIQDLRHLLAPRIETYTLNPDYLPITSVVAPKPDLIAEAHSTTTSQASGKKEADG